MSALTCTFVERLNMPVQQPIPLDACALSLKGDVIFSRAQQEPGPSGSTSTFVSLVCT